MILEAGALSHPQLEGELSDAVLPVSSELSSSALLPIHPCDEVENLPPLGRAVAPPACIRCRFAHDVSRLQARLARCNLLEAVMTRNLQNAPEVFPMGSIGKCHP